MFLFAFGREKKNKGKNVKVERNFRPGKVAFFDLPSRS